MQTMEETWAARYTLNLAHDVERGYSYIAWDWPAQNTALEAWYEAWHLLPGTHGRDRLYQRLEAAVEAERDGELTDEERQDLIDTLEYVFRPHFAAPLNAGWFLAKPGLSAFYGDNPEEALESLQDDRRFDIDENVYVFRVEIVGRDEDRDVYSGYIARVEPLAGPVFQVRDGKLVRVGEIVEEGGRLRYRGE